MLARLKVLTCGEKIFRNQVGDPLSLPCPPPPQVNHTFNDNQINWFKNGSALNAMVSAQWFEFYWPRQAKPETEYSRCVCRLLSSRRRSDLLFPDS